MISASTAVSIVQAAEQHNAMIVLSDNPREKTWINPSMNLVERALDRWSSTRMRADNTSVVTLMLDPPGPPRSQVIRNAQKLLSEQPQQAAAQCAEQEHPSNHNLAMADCSKSPTLSNQTCENRRDLVLEDQYPATGLQILTRYENQQRQENVESSSVKPCYTEEYLDKLHQEFYSSMLIDPNKYWEESSADSTEEKSSQTSFLEVASCSTSTATVEEAVTEKIQINVVSSSSDLEKRTKTRKTNGRNSKSLGLETDIANTSKSLNTGSKVSTSLKIDSESKINKKLKVQSKNNSLVSYDFKRDRQQERRCRSLGPSEAESLGVKTRNKTLEINEKQARIVQSQSIERSRIAKCEKTIEKCDSNFKRSRSLGPCDIKHSSDIQKTRIQTSSENLPLKKGSRTHYLKSKNTEDTNQNFQVRRSKSLGPKEDYTTKTTRISQLNSNLFDRSSIESDEENISDTRLKRSKSLGPGDLLNLKSAQTISKNKSKLQSSFNDINIKRDQSQSTKNVAKNEKFTQFHTPRTRSQGLTEVSCSKKTRSNILKPSGVSK